MITERKKRFAFEYAKDGNGLRAAIRAGYSEAGAGDTAHRVLQDPEVQALIEEHKETAGMVAQLSHAWVLRKWIDIVNANPADLVRVVVRPCTKCWATIEDKELRVSLVDPNPSCELCLGSGVKVTILTDTLKLKGPAKYLYAGAKQTKDGIEIKMRDQDAALKNIAAYLGMDRRVNELTGPNGGPLQLTPVKAEDLTDDQLAEIIAGKSVSLGVGSGVLLEGSLGSTETKELTD